MVLSSDDGGSTQGAPSMDPGSKDLGSRELRLAQVFADCSDRLHAGERVDLDHVIARHPDLAPDLAFMLEALRDLAQGSRPDSLPVEIGGFQILREIGRGGMGVVYEAWHQPLGRHVALKVLLPGVLSGDKQVERFRREARAAARLQHRNIVPVFDVGEDGGRHYYAMKLISGETLSDFIEELATRRHGRNGPRLEESRVGSLTDRLLNSSWSCPVPDWQASGTTPASLRGEEAGEVPQAPPSRPAPSGPAAIAAPQRDAGRKAHYHAAARIGLQVVEALAYAHDEGVLHRDIKPLNLLLDAAGTVWIADFGLAKMDDAEQITRTRDVVGTMAYMAPERFSGWSDRCSDVYSLGLVLYELLTLRPAFADANPTRLMNRVMHEEPPRPRRIDPQIPRDFETVVLKAIAKDPRQRYQSAAQLASDLRALVEDRPIQARRVSRAERLWRWSRRNPAVAASSTSAFVLLLTLVAVLTEEVWRLETEISTMQSFTAASSPDAWNDPQLKLQFGVHESLDRMELIGQFKPFMEQLAKDLSKRTGKRVRIDGRVFAGDYEGLIRKFAGGEIDFVRFGPVSYVQARELNPAIRLLVMEMEGGSPERFHDSHIFVRKDSDIDAPSQLRRKHVAFADPYSTSGTIYLKAELAREGITRSQVTTRSFDRHDEIIAAVVDRQFAAGCTRYSYFENAKLRFPDQLKAIRTFQVPNKPWVAGEGLDESTLAALTDSLLSFVREHPASRELTDLKVDGFEVATPDDYDQVEEVFKKAEEFDRG